MPVMSPRIRRLIAELRTGYGIGHIDAADLIAELLEEHKRLRSAIAKALCRWREHDKQDDAGVREDGPMAAYHMSETLREAAKGLRP